MRGTLEGIVMLARVAAFAIAFGLWDISFYAGLKLMIGWPQSLFTWDILFLIPLPWWGPVLAPISIALLLIVFGLLATVLEQGEPPLVAARNCRSFRPTHR